MNTQDNIKPLIKAMRAALKRDHGLDVPYSALRASYLSAAGLNPHAQPAAKPRPAPSYYPESMLVVHPAETDFVTCVLHLAEDEIGCVTSLSLGSDGELPLLDWVFPAGDSVVALTARVPSIRKYGLPEYASDPSKWFAHFGLQLAPTFSADSKITDSCDDSGDTASVTVRMSQESFELMTRHALRHDAATADAIADWVGLHYRKVFETLSSSEAATRVVAFVDFLEQLKASDHVEEMSADVVRFEWVYPDEDSDFRDCSVDGATGVLTLSGDAVPADIEYLDRVRLYLETDTGDLTYDAFLDRSVTPAVWRLTAEALAEFHEDKPLG